jgi:transposase/transposase IS116/IS110/IS902 family protein
VPGRDKKTDPTDCEWIQRLHSCGLLQGSFRPEEAVCMLRTLVRDKANLVAARGDWLRRMQKSLDQMNVRVHRAVSDIDGVTGMAILRAIAGGERDALKLAKLRDPRSCKTEQEIAEQLRGHWREDHLFSLQQALQMYDAVEERIAAYEKEILRKLGDMEREEQGEQTAPPLKNANKSNMIKKRGQEPIRQALYRMSGVDATHIDTIGVETLEVVLSEYGPDLSRFPTEKQFVSHVTLAPHVPTSGGKAAEEEKSEQHEYPCRSRFAHGGAFPAPQPDRPGSVLSQDGPTARRRHCRVRHRPEVGHADLPAAQMGPAVCGRRRKGLRSPLSPAARRTLGSHSQTTRLSARSHKCLRSRNKRRKVTGQHRQVVILGRRPSLHRGHNPVRRLSRLQYGCPLQQLAQSLVSKKFSRWIRRFNNAVRIQQDAITSLQFLERIQRTKAKVRYGPA